MPKNNVERNWCFTLNNPTALEISFLGSLEHEQDGFVKGLVYQLELSKTGTPHLQGYVEFNRACRLLQAKRWMGTRRIRMEPRKKSRRAAFDYCLKEDTRISPGVTCSWGIDLGLQGKRNDIDGALQSIRDGDSAEDVWDSFGSVMVRYPRGMQNAVQHYAKGRSDEPITVVVFWGRAGMGKSYAARHLFPEAYYAPVSVNGFQWFDGYEGEFTIIFEDVDPKYIMDLPTFKNLCDSGPMPLPTKGGHVACAARTIVFTSNCNWRDWYPKADYNNREAIERRVDLAYEYRHGAHGPLVEWCSPAKLFNEREHGIICGSASVISQGIKKRKREEEAADFVAYHASQSTCM